MAADAAAAGAAAARVPRPVRAVLAGIDRLGRLDGWLGAGCLVLLTTLLLCEIVLRAVTSLPQWLPLWAGGGPRGAVSAVTDLLPHGVPDAWEYCAYLMAATFTFGAAMTLRAGGHIRVNLLLGRLGPGGRRALEAAASLLAGASTSFLAVAMARFTWNAFERGQVSISSGSPLWPPQAVVTFGMALLAIQFVARFVQACYGLPVEDHSMKVASVAE